METTEMVTILKENYYTLATTGAQAIEAVWGDIAEGNFDNQDDWGVSMSELVTAVNAFAKWITDEGYLFSEARNTVYSL